MKTTAVCLAVALMGQPSLAATLQETQMSGVVTGEAMCSLARQGAPEAVLREEFSRLTSKMTHADVVDLVKFGQAYLDVIEQVMRSCPKRGLPDA